MQSGFISPSNSLVQNSKVLSPFSSPEQKKAFLDITKPSPKVTSLKSDRSAPLPSSQSLYRSAPTRSSVSVDRQENKSIQQQLSSLTLAMIGFKASLSQEYPTEMQRIKK